MQRRLRRAPAVGLTARCTFCLAGGDAASACTGPSCAARASRTPHAPAAATAYAYLPLLAYLPSVLPHARALRTTRIWIRTPQRGIAADIPPRTRFANAFAGNAAELCGCNPTGVAVCDRAYAPRTLCTCAARTLPRHWLLLVYFTRAPPFRRGYRISLLRTSKHVCLEGTCVCAGCERTERQLNERYRLAQRTDHATCIPLLVCQVFGAWTRCCNICLPERSVHLSRLTWRLCALCTCHAVLRARFVRGTQHRAYHITLLRRAFRASTRCIPAFLLDMSWLAQRTALRRRRCRGTVLWHFGVFIAVFAAYALRTRGDARVSRGAYGIAASRLQTCRLNLEHAFYHCTPYAAARRAYQQQHTYATLPAAVPRGGTFALLRYLTRSGA